MQSDGRPIQTDRHERSDRDRSKPDPRAEPAIADGGRAFSPVGSRRLEVGLWIVFAALFGIAAVSVYLPVEPIVFVFPFWAVVVLATMIIGTIAAVIAGVGYGWPGEHR